MQERQLKLDNFVRKTIAILRKRTGRVFDKTIAEIIDFDQWPNLTTISIHHEKGHFKVPHALGPTPSACRPSCS
jgi:hypothetical protein